MDFFLVNKCDTEHGSWAKLGAYCALPEGKTLTVEESKTFFADNYEFKCKEVEIYKLIESDE